MLKVCRPNCGYGSGRVTHVELWHIRKLRIPVSSRDAITSNAYRS